jgi:hypothetical protein
MARAGQITVTSAGTPVQGSDVQANDIYIAGHPSNAGNVWVSGVGDAAKYPIPAGQQIVVNVGNLNALEFDADTDGDIACWLIYW